MSDKSAIEWTDATWNPVTGCTKVSAGCKHCYAETFSERFRGVSGHPYEQGFDLKLWPDRLNLPLSWKKPRRVFVNSMSDLFHEGIPDEFIESVFDTMALSQRHTFQVLTKRAERMRAFVFDASWPTWPLSNVWLGTSVENVDHVQRIAELGGCLAWRRFLSLEPLLGPLPNLPLDAVDWVIVGGESGRGARPMDPTWVREIRDQCLEQAVPFFFKQWGGTNKKAAGRILDGRTWDEFPETASKR